jgi:hypothetical protein
VNGTGSREPIRGTSAYWFAEICVRIRNHKRTGKIRKNRSKNKEEKVSEDDDIKEVAGVTVDNAV